MNRRTSVRQFEASDRDAWAPLWDGYLRFYRAVVPKETTDRTFAALCDSSNDWLGLLALSGSEAVGLAHLLFHPSTWSTEERCYLEDLYVAPSYRGGQVANAMFDAVFDAAQARNAERVYWHTQAFNGAARSLYDSVGSLTSRVVYERRLNAGRRGRPAG